MECKLHTVGINMKATVVEVLFQVHVMAFEQTVCTLIVS